MKTIIAGGRDYRGPIEVPWEVSVVVSGKARGADSLGEQWAKSNGIPVEEYPADWDAYGKRAGFMRNSDMANNAEALVAYWDGKSRGTKSMIELAIKKGLILQVNYYRLPCKSRRR